jgi:hypothetical protein
MKRTRTRRGKQRTSGARRDTRAGRERRRGADRRDSGTTPDPLEQVHRSTGNQAVGTTVQRQADEGDGNGEFETDVSERAAVSAVTRALRNRGFTPAPGLTLDDYVRTDVSRASRGETETGTREAFVRVGPDGNLLPGPAYVAREREAGNVEPGTLQGATRFLNFEMFQYPDGQHDVAMKLTNVESGVITNQRMGEGGALNTGLTDAIDDAWEQFDVEFGQPTDGRIPEGQRTSTGTGGSGGSDAPGGQQSSPEVGGPPGRSASGERGPPFGTGLSSPAGAGLGSARSDGGADGSTYTVEAGDTLWDIAEREYGDARMWGLVYEANRRSEENPEGIVDPDLIHPGQELTLPPQSAAESFDPGGYTPPPSTGVGKGPF